MNETALSKAKRRGPAYSRWLRRVRSVIHSVFHLFWPFLYRLFKSSTTQRRSRLQHGYYIGVSRRSAQATAGKGLAQGTYVAARAGVEPTTFRLTVIDLTLHHQFHKYTCIYITLYNTDTPRVNGDYLYWMRGAYLFRDAD